jgi:hypothetical protein
MQPDLEHLKNKVKANRDLLDRILIKLPGFKGYAEKAEIFETDRVIRNMLADKLQGFKHEINSLSNLLVKKHDTSHLSDLEALNLLLERVLKKCKYADSGSTAIHGRSVITDDDKNRLLEYDWRLITVLDEFDGLIKELISAGPDTLGQKMMNFETKMKEFEKNFDERKNVLLEVI